MPEDIPEDLELPPDPPPPPPPSLPPEPPKNPDFWLFVGITLGVFCALVFSLLQMDNVQINWQLSAILYALFTGGAVASFLVHAAPHRSKLVRFIGSFIMLALFGALGFWGTRSEYKKQHAPPDTTLSNQVSFIARGVSSLATNDKAVTDQGRIGLLTTEQNTESNEQTKLSQEYASLESQPDDLATIRGKTQNLMQQKADEKRQQELQSQEDAINIQRQQKADLEAQKESATEAQKALLKIRRQLSEPVLPVYDYVIHKLNQELLLFKNETGKQIYTDLNPESPSIYTSNLEKDGAIVKGTNYIGIGTNSAWKFQISTTDTQTTPLWFGDYPNWYYYCNIQILCATTNGQSQLNVLSGVTWSLYPHHNVVSGWYGFPKVFGITFKAPNGITMDEQISATNTQNEIDEAIDRLIGAQDQQCPITN